MATTSATRIQSLDVIRGIAVMGIFSVNVVGMAMIQQAYFYPPDFGFEHGYDKLMWALNSIFVDGRFRALFSILFGASTVVVCERAVAAGRDSWQVHYPRMIVLLLFGLAHFYLLWWGDILANYAMVGMVAWFFWRLQPRWLILVAVVCLGTDLGLHAVGAVKSLQSDFAPLTYFPWTQVYVSPFHPVGAMGYAALIILLMGRSAAWDRIAAVGRTAFTNYLGATLIGTLVFFDTFGGLYAEVSRGQAWLLVPVVWAIMLVWSKWWLERYRFGPFEWAWRSLSRMEWQPMRKAPPAVDAVPA